VTSNSKQDASEDPKQVARIYKQCICASPHPYICRQEHRYHVQLQIPQIHLYTEAVAQALQKINNNLVRYTRLGLCKRICNLFPLYLSLSTPIWPSLSGKRMLHFMTTHMANRKHTGHTHRTTDERPSEWCCLLIRLFLLPLVCPQIEQIPKTILARIDITGMVRESPK